jgi:hypothetical protein
MKKKKNQYKLKLASGPNPKCKVCDCYLQFKDCLWDEERYICSNCGSIFIKKREATNGEEKYL